MAVQTVVPSKLATSLAGLMPGTSVTSKGVQSIINTVPSSPAAQIVAPKTTAGTAITTPKVLAPVNPNGPTTTATTAPVVKVDKSNDIALQQAGLGAVDSQQTAGTAAIAAALAKLTGEYDTEAATDKGVYQTSSDANENNLQKDKQTALVNAAQGRQGLMGTLSSLGALSGSGIQLADRAVQKGANDDLSGAADTYSTNESGLDNALSTFEQEDEQRRQDAATAAANATTNAANDAAKSRMSFLSNISNDYADESDAADATKYSSQAAALYPTIASTNVPDSNIAYSSAAFTPTTLSNYLNGANSTQVAVTPNNGTGTAGLVASPTAKKLTPVTV